MANPRRQVIPLMGGHNSKRDPGMVGVNQLIKSQGVEYLLGDSEIIHKIPGRSLFGDVAAVGRVDGLALATYDDATTFLLAVGGRDLYYADASNGFTGTFTAFTHPSGTLHEDTEFMTAAHYNNQWFVHTGLDRGVMISSDASIVPHGMVQPTGEFTVGALSISDNRFNGSVVTYTSSVSNSENGWQNTDVIATAPFNPSIENLETQDYAYISFENLQFPGVFPIAIAELTLTVTQSFSDQILELQHAFNTSDGQWFSTVPSDTPQDQAWAGAVLLDISTLSNTVSYSQLAYYSNNQSGNWNAIKREQVAIPASVDLQYLRVRLRVFALGLEAIRDQIETPDVQYRIYSLALTNSGNTTFTNSVGNMYYAYSEYDPVNGIESPLSPAKKIDQNEAFGAIKVTLPAEAKNANSSQFLVYRTTNLNTALVESEFGRFASVPVGANGSVVLDTFGSILPSESPPQKYEWLILDEFGVKSYYDLNSPPPPLEFIGHFQGALFGLRGRTYYQSMPGRPHQWPSLFKIQRFPFRQNSPLRAGVQVGDVLWIGAEAGIILLDYPAQTRAGALRLPPIRQLEGAPGCTGRYAATGLSFGGESLVAWVSNHGVYISNLATFDRVTDDLKWEETVTEASLNKAVLFWREKRQQLVLLYDTDEDGENDAFMLIHMGPDQRGPTGKPLITLGHPGKFTQWTGGRIGGVWKEFSCANAAEGVYLEGGSQTADVSNSFNTASDIPVDIQTGRHYYSEAVDVGRSQLFTSEVDSDLTLTIQYTTGRDDDIADRTSEILLLLSGARSQWRNFNVFQSGDFMQWRFQHTGQVKFSLGPVAPMVDGDDERGDLA